MRESTIENRRSTNLALDELSRALDGGGLSRNGKGDEGGDGSEGLHFWEMCGEKMGSKKVYVLKTGLIFPNTKGSVVKGE